MNIGKIIAERRAELGLTLEQIGAAVGVSKSTVKKWEDGYISNMKRDKIESLSRVLMIDPISLITGELSPLPLIPKMKKIPILGKTACGDPIFSPNYDDGYALIGENFEADFALEAKGDSMKDAGICDGDTVYFKEQDMVDNGQIAAVFIDGEVTLKRVYYYRDKNKLVLRPENPEYEPLVFVNGELDSIRIIGRAVAHLRKI